MADPTVPASPETVHWGYFDAAREPVLTVPSGSTVVIETVSGELANMPTDDARFPLQDALKAVHAAGKAGPGPHLVTGPIKVEGAKAGTALEVRIKDIVPTDDWGWMMIAPLLGTLPEDFPDKTHYHIPVDKSANTCSPPWGKPIPLAPFFGVMGVAPPPGWGRVSTVEPRDFGGNMDNKELIAGVTVYFPVFVDGAMFSVGDGHGVQGDGEVCVTALETSLTGTFELFARDDLALARPQAESADAYITMAFDPDLDDAAKTALRDMIDLLAGRHGMSRYDAYALCSLAADVRVTQLVDGNKGIHVVLPKSVV